MKMILDKVILIIGIVCGSIIIDALQTAYSILSTEDSLSSLTSEDIMNDILGVHKSREVEIKFYRLKTGVSLKISSGQEKTIQANQIVSVYNSASDTTLIKVKNCSTGVTGSVARATLLSSAIAVPKKAIDPVKYSACFADQ